MGEGQCGMAFMWVLVSSYWLRVSLQKHVAWQDLVSVEPIFSLNRVLARIEMGNC